MYFLDLIRQLSDVWKFHGKWMTGMTKYRFSRSIWHFFQSNSFRVIRIRALPRNRWYRSSKFRISACEFMHTHTLSWIDTEVHLWAFEFANVQPTVNGISRIRMTIDEKVCTLCKFTCSYVILNDYLRIRMLLWHGDRKSREFVCSSYQFDCHNREIEWENLYIPTRE